MTLTEFNRLPSDAALVLLLQCCSCERWAQGMLLLRPFADSHALVTAAERCWQGLTEADYLQAFEGHPKIGDVASLRAKYANTQALASNEQSSVQQASEQQLQQLSALNEQYLQKFGFIFIVFASGKSAGEMLALLQARIGNTRAQELANAAAEQAKITELRLKKLFA